MEIKKYSEHFEVFEELKEKTTRRIAFMEVNKSKGTVDITLLGDNDKSIFKIEFHEFEMDNLKKVLDFALGKLKENGNC